MLKRILLLTIPFAFTGCVSQAPSFSVGTDHPANPAAVEAPVEAASSTLAITSPTVEPSPPQAMEEHDMSSMHHGGMDHMKMNGGASMPSTSQKNGGD